MTKATDSEPIDAYQPSPAATLHRKTPEAHCRRIRQWLGATPSGRRDGMSQRILDTACINV